LATKAEVPSPTFLKTKVTLRQAIYTISISCAKTV